MVVSDVVIQILSKLPPESLLRFKSVCKSWYVLINDPKFVAKHLLDSFSHKHVLLKRILTNNFGKKELALSILKFSPDRSVSVMDINLPFQEINPFFEVCGHAHGIVCLSDLDNAFLINPMTSQFRKLPPSILTFRGCSAVALAIGFGYDAKSSNFKVVRMVGFWGNSIMLMPSPIRVEIYDLSKDKWREIGAPSFDGRASWTPSFDMYHEGTFYWWGCGEPRINEAGRIEHIITFDMSEEVFGKISVPKSYDDKKHKTSLGVLNRSIVLFVYPFESNETNIDIWEMKKDESSVVSWSKLLTIVPTFGIEQPLLFVSCEELLMESRNGHVIMYNCKTQEFKKLPIEGQLIGVETNRFEATLYIKSLVSLEGRDIEL
ncbi:F-box protein CPR1-like [Cucumis melo]|uniref:F-box protein CPR1-like n=1 Tax=Cucumis melo TaxID=3656 RepID=A0A1S3B5Y1_CUCME|nr:F-box protein CPR1-like [Cucumis melo]XP_050940121.1 F-box protein CPR1-like [Cucumis melo]